jgi:anti-sigma-K factor RskA
MLDKADQKRLMVQYLFGELSADERAEFEDSYLKDGDIFQELVACENEMIDRYVLGEISGAEREKFERTFLNDPARRQMVETARSLLAYSAAEENVLSRPSLPVSEKGYRSGIFRVWGIQVAAAAVFLAMIGGILWLASSNRRLENELATLRREQATAAQDRQEKQALQQQVASLQSELQQRDSAIQQMAQLHDHDTVSFSLGPGLVRGSNEMARLVIPARASYVSLQVFIEHDSHPRYTLSLRTAEGGLVWRSDELPGRLVNGGNKEIVVTLPVRLLQNGDYVVRVSAGDEDPLHALAGYSFHVIRR